MKVVSEIALRVACAAMVLFAPAAAAAICRVTASGSASGGGSWAAPMDLHTALADASCSEVWVAAGSYKPTAGTDRAVHFAIRPGTAVYGGFAGGETQRVQRDPVAHPSILSGDIGTPGDDADNTRHVVVMDGTTAAGIVDGNTVLDGFTISGGNADGILPPEAYGGGLLCLGGGTGSECSPTLSRLVFSGNTADWGGALYNDGSSFGASSPLLLDVVFSDNYANYSGGAVYNRGIENGVSSPRLAGVVFDGNAADDFGGAMYNSAIEDGDSSPQLEKVVFTGNSAFSGGAVYNQGDNDGVSSPLLHDVVFDGNSAEYQGGAMYNSGRRGDCSPQLSAVTFSNNTSQFWAGAIYNLSNQTTGTMWMGNVTFSNNYSAGRGGALFNDSYYGNNYPAMRNVTFSGNRAASGGGAIYNTTTTGVMNAILSNVIVWSDSADAATQIVNAGDAATTVDHSIIVAGCAAFAGNECNDGNSAGDPLLNPLADNGGFTQTMLPGMGGSAIDAGSAATCAFTLVDGVDQRGMARPAGNGCDIGAVEVQGEVIFADGFDA